MKTLPDTIIVRPFLLGALFGAKPLTLSIQRHNLLISLKNETVEIPFEEIPDSAVKRKGLIFYKVRISNNQKSLNAGWLKSSDAQRILDLVLDKYHQVIAGTIVELYDSFEKQLALHYPRKRVLLRWREKCLLWRKRFKRQPSTDVVSPEQRYAFEFIAQFADTNEHDIQHYQDTYITKQLSKYKTYFDEIESHPLTHQQRVACVADEENNLVIAGAGSGKTSVMMGRAGYLVKSGQSSAKEILMLAFGRKAALEMSERISEKLPGIDVSASTFHSLGQLIIANVENGKPSLSHLAEDDHAFRRFVDNCFQELIKDTAYQAIAVNYFLEYLNEEVNPFEYQQEGEYLQALIDNDIRTLNGEQVKSFQESVIANYLLRQGIDYRYEHKYEHVTRTLDYRQYKPDFYLPNPGIYIEHYGIDENNNTAPYVDRESYLKGMDWKRKLHEQHGTICLETYHFEYKRGELLSNLREKLLAAGVEMQPMDDDAILKDIQQKMQLTEFTGLLTNMLGLYKMANMTPEKITQKADTAENPGRFRAAVGLLLPIIDQYQHYLDEMEDIDFNDMINRAIEYLRDGKFRPAWKYIMVDEFQDISGPRAELIRLLHEKCDNSSLFCVGDDWQAIYRFAGSDLSYMTGFEEKFGITCVTKLDMTFRFNNSISDIATQFVTRNPDQIRKDIKTISSVPVPAISLLRTQNNTEEDQISSLTGVLEAIVQREDDTRPTVIILGRYHFTLPQKERLQQLRQHFSGLQIDMSTIHAAKGNEADYVIVVNLESGKHGFPSEKITHPLLEALLPEKQTYTFAEERRLFYVAITRARRRVYLLCDMARASRFIVELLNKQYAIEKDEFTVASSQLLCEQVHCIRCETGKLVPRNGPHGNFYGCTHFPRCRHAENGCDCCGAPMKREGLYKICTDTDCSGWIPVCTVCQAEMVVRQGRYGEFWGCRNYRKNGPSCNHTENLIPPPRESTSGTTH